MIELIAFTKTQLGQILIRVIFVSFIGAGIGLVIKKISDRIGLYKSERRKKIIHINSEIISYISNIGISVYMSWMYHYNDGSITSALGEGILYGLGAIALQAVAMGGGLLDFIRAFRRK